MSAIAVAGFDLAEGNAIDVMHFTQVHGRASITARWGTGTTLEAVRVFANLKLLAPAE